MIVILKNAQPQSMKIVEQRVIQKYLRRNKYEKNFMFDFSGTNVLLSPLKQLRPILFMMEKSMFIMMTT